MKGSGVAATSLIAKLSTRLKLPKVQAATPELPLSLDDLVEHWREIIPLEDRYGGALPAELAQLNSALLQDLYPVHPYMVYGRLLSCLADGQADPDHRNELVKSLLTAVYLDAVGNDHITDLRLYAEIQPDIINKLLSSVVPANLQYGLMLHIAGLSLLVSETFTQDGSGIARWDTNWLQTLKSYTPLIEQIAQFVTETEKLGSYR